jgi:hypothetical protein
MNHNNLEDQAAARAQLACINDYMQTSLKNAWIFIGLVGLKASLAAIDGALGFEIVKTSHKDIPAEFNLSNTVLSQVIGSVCLSPISVTAYFGVYYAFRGCYDDERYGGMYGVPNPDNDSSISGFEFLAWSCLVMVPLHILAATLDAVTGATALGLLVPDPLVKPTPQSDFAAAVGAAGGAVSMLGIYATLISAYIIYLLKTAYCTNAEAPTAPRKNMLNAFKSSTQKQGHKTQQNNVADPEVPTAIVTQIPTASIATLAAV